MLAISRFVNCNKQVNKVERGERQREDRPQEREVMREERKRMEKKENRAIRGKER